MHLFRLEQVVSQVGKDVGVILDGSVVMLAAGKILFQKVPKGHESRHMTLMTGCKDMRASK